MNKKHITIILCTWIILLGVTYILAISSKENHSSITEILNSEKEEEEVILEGVTIYDTYDENSIIIDIVEVDKNISYVQIAGLKNEDTESKINKMLKERFEEMQRKVDSYDPFVSMSVEGNFSNILSIELSGSKRISSSKIEKYEEYININLNDGSIVKFEDLFLNKNNIKSILSKSINKYLYDEVARTSNTNYDDLDNEALKLLNSLDYDNVEFLLYSNSIFIKLNDDVYITILVNDNPKELVYQKRYNSKDSIYKNDDIGLKKIIIAERLSSRDLFYTKYKYNDKKDVYYNFNILGWNDIEFAERNSLSEKLNIDKFIEELSKKEENEYLYVNGYGDISKSDLNLDIYTLKYYYQTCKMNKDTFNNIENKLFLKEDTKGVGFYTNITTFEDKNIVCDIHDSVNIYTIDIDGNKIEKYSDLFKDGYDYKKIILDKVNSNENVSVKYTDIDNFYNYYFTENYIVIELSEDGEGIDIPYSEFAIGYFKVSENE